MIEEKITAVVADYFASGKVEEKVSEAIDAALSKLTGNYGDLTMVIEEQIKSSMMPIIEKSDYSQYVTKMDATLVEILKHKTAGNNQILANFKEIVTTPKEITTEQIFEKYCKFVSANVDTSDLEVDFDDEPSYIPVTVGMELAEKEERRFFSDRNNKKYLVRCFCEEDDDVEVTFELDEFYGGKFKVRAHLEDSFSTLCNLNDFQAFILGLDMEWSHVTVDDVNYIDDEVEVDAEPEASFA